MAVLSPEPAEAEHDKVYRRFTFQVQLTEKPRQDYNCDYCGKVVAGPIPVFRAFLKGEWRILHPECAATYAYDQLQEFIQAKNKRVKARTKSGRTIVTRR